jgi:hypothetical protein
MIHRPLCEPNWAKLCLVEKSQAVTLSLATLKEVQGGEFPRRQRWLTTPPLFSTVCARRFCDQHEMSLQTATGRSLP